MYTNQKELFFLDGHYHILTESKKFSLNPWMLRGQGAFETMRVYDGRIAFVDEHLNRLLKALKILNIKINYRKSDFKKYLHGVIYLNKIKEGRLRLTIWQEKNVHLSIIATPYKPYALKEYRKGYRAIVYNPLASRNKSNPYVKSIKYQFFLKAYHKAKVQRYDEAIVLNHQRQLMECSRSNIFFVKNGKLFTPHLKCGCLKGITRQNVIKLAKKFRIPFQNVFCSWEDLLSAQEVFITNSLIEIMPVTLINKKIIGSGKMGKVTQRFLREYRKLISGS